MATQADGLTSSVPDPLSEVLGCGLDSGDDRRQAQAYACLLYTSDAADEL